MESRFQSLRILIRILQWGAILQICVFVAISLFSGALPALLNSIVNGLVLYILGELGLVILSIEENTRATAEMLRRLRRSNRENPGE
jgi:hypothetical protein